MDAKLAQQEFIAAESELTGRVSLFQAAAVRSDRAGMDRQRLAAEGALSRKLDALEALMVATLRDGF